MHDARGSGRGSGGLHKVSAIVVVLSNGQVDEAAMADGIRKEDKE